MKNLLLSLVVLTVGVTSQATSPKLHSLQIVKDAMYGRYHAGALPKGFTDRELKTRPRITGHLAGYLAKLEEQKQEQWKDYVLTNDEEFGDLSRAQRRAKANNPYGELDVDYLVEVQEVHAIYENGKLVGYVFQTADHVQAAIYQDGAGIEIYVTPDQFVVTTDEWAA